MLHESIGIRRRSASCIPSGPGAEGRIRFKTLASSGRSMGRTRSSSGRGRTGRLLSRIDCRSKSSLQNGSRVSSGAGSRGTCHSPERHSSAAALRFLAYRHYTLRYCFRLSWRRERGGGGGTRTVVPRCGRRSPEGVLPVDPRPNFVGEGNGSGLRPRQFQVTVPYLTPPLFEPVHRPLR